MVQPGGRSAVDRAPQHVVLLGDSIFDNGAYVPGEPDVVHQLARHLPTEALATLLARDGAIVDDVHRQLNAIPADATHLVLSAGGNDALGHIGIIGERAAGMQQALERLHAMRAEFAGRYRRLVDAVLRRGIATAVCTIYEGNLPESEQRAASAALTMFNDAILRAAFETRVDVIDLRLVCSTPACYANPIEPSAIGGDRIARAIAQLVTGEYTDHRTMVFGA